MGATALYGHLAHIAVTGYTIPNPINWDMTVAGRSANLTSGTDSAAVSEGDYFHSAEGSFAALCDRTQGEIPVNTQAAAVFYLYQAFTVDVTSAGLGDKVTVNGIDFTRAAATAVATHAWLDAVGLAACINNQTYGAPDARASAAGNVVTIVGYTAVLTVTDTDVGGTITTVDISRTRSCSIEITEHEIAPAMDEAERVEVTYSYKSVSVIVDEDSNRI